MFSFIGFIEITRDFIFLYSIAFSIVKYSIKHDKYQYKPYNLDLKRNTKTHFE
jgi:hypothetical protein